MKELAFCDISLADKLARFGAKVTRALPFADLGDLRQTMASDTTLLQGDLADFRRAADNVRLAQLGSLLCASVLADAWSPEGTAIIGLNGDGCAHNNRQFWDDFLAHGRDTGRASLFVPTLPSIPACEAAIALGVHGAVRYLKTVDKTQTSELLAEMFASDSQLRQIMTIEISAVGATIHLLGRE